MTAPHDGARADIRKRHDAPRCLVCGNSVAVDASALAAAKAEAWAEGYFARLGDTPLYAMPPNPYLTARPEAS